MRIVTVVFGIVSLTTAAFAADLRTTWQHLVSTWKLDLSKSKLLPSRQLASETLKIDEIAPNIFRSTIDDTTTSGQTRHSEQIRHIDGKEHPAEGVNAGPGTDVEIAQRGAGDFDSTIIRKRGGKVITELDGKLSPDGKKLTVNRKGVSARGESYEEVLIYVQQ